MNPSLGTFWLLLVLSSIFMEYFSTFITHVIVVSNLEHRQFFKLKVLYTQCDVSDNNTIYLYHSYTIKVLR